MTQFRLACVVALALLFAGCPADVGPEDAPVEGDAPAALDTDMDGTPDDVDCDPASPTVGRAGSRVCDHECGPRTESCTDGAWGACVPALDCRCTMEGERRIAPCGFCGEESQECIAGRWTAVSMCLNEGCMPGAVETRTGDLCLEEQRLCGETCEWSDWSVTHPMGTCMPGHFVCLPGALDWYCNDDCMRVEDDPCCPAQDPPIPGCETRGM